MTARTTEITDDVAQQVANALAAHFGAELGYEPKAQDADWDGGSGRVITWPEGLPDWALLVNHGGVSGYGCPIEYDPVPLPALVWVEPVNEQAIRVLPRP